MTDEQTPLVVRRSRWLVFGTLLALVLLYVPLLGPSLVGLRTSVETGVVLRFEPWVETADPKATEHVAIAHDTVDSYLPTVDVVVKEARKGHLATWEPYTAGGAPAASLPNMGLLAPQSWPFFILPLSYAPGVLRLLEILACLVFMYLFLRRLRLLPGPALLGAMLYSTSGFIVLWNNWPQAQVASLLPSLLWSVERLLQIRRLKAVVPVALSMAALWLAGFPAIVVYGLYLLGPYVLVRTVRWRVRPVELLRRWLLPAGGLVLGVSLAAIQLVPFERYLHTLDLGYRAQNPKAHPPPQALLTVLEPYAFGTETNQTWFGYRNTIETIAFFGVVGVALCVIGLCLRVRGPVAEHISLFFLGVVVVLVLVGWMSDDALRVAQKLPFIGTSFIGRIRSVLGLSLAVLAAIGADKLLRLPGQRRVMRWWALAPLAALLLFGVRVVEAAWHTATVDHRTAVLLHNSRPPIIVAAALLVLLPVALRPGRVGLVAVGVIPLLLAGEAFVFIAPAWPSDPKSQLYPTTNVHEFLARNLGEERFGSAGGVMFPSTSTYYRLRQVNGHGFPSPTWRQAIARTSPAVHEGGTLLLLGNDEATANSPLLDRLATKYFVASVNSPVYGVDVPGPAATGSAVVGGSTEIDAKLTPQQRRAIVVNLTAPLTGATQASMTATFTDATGTVVGTVVRRGVTAGQTGAIEIPVAGETGPLTTATAVRIRFTGVVAHVATTVDGRAAVGSVLPADDGLRLAFAGDAVVYQRLNALPRFRFVTRAEHIADPTEALDALAAGNVAPNDVLFEDTPSDPGPGGTGSVRVLEEGDTHLSLRATSTSGGWVVVADALQDGWVAEVDGKRADIQNADHAAVAVRVPAGVHSVVLRYAAPGLRLGILITLVTALLLLVMAFADRLPRLRRDHTRRVTDASALVQPREEVSVYDR